MSEYRYSLAADRPEDFKRCIVQPGPFNVQHGAVALSPAYVRLNGDVEMNLPDKIIEKLSVGQSIIVPYFQKLEVDDGVNKPPLQLISFEIMDVG